jgi:2-keto-3-deoxy-L-rhamnonate aldolase RhmA
MTMGASHSLDAALADGGVALGLGQRAFREELFHLVARECGFDWIFIDLEHGPLSYGQASTAMLGALQIGMTPIVRVGGHEAFHAYRALTNGAAGIIFPHVENAKDAARCAAHCRFAPQGDRGVPAFFPQIGLTKPPLPDAIATINAMTRVVVMLESAQAVTQADSIAAVDGVDILFVGASDLTVELGLPGDYRNPAVIDALNRIAAACARHGKVAGIGGIKDEALLGELIGKGFRFILAGNDLDLFMPAGKARAEGLRTLTREVAR